MQWLIIKFELNTQLAMFEDDTTIIAQCKFLKSPVQNLQIYLNTVTTWFQKWNCTWIQKKIQL